MQDTKSVLEWRMMCKSEVKSINLAGIEIFLKKYLHKVQMEYLYFLHFGMSTCTLVDTCMIVHVFFKL